MIWSVSNIFDYRGKKCIDKNKNEFNIELFASGWAIGNFVGMDIWEACRYLNDMEARGLK